MRFMQQIIFLMIEVAVAVVIIALDRKRLRDYILLGLFTLACAYVLETACAFLGFWQYYAEPQIPIISLYTWLAYVPYISFCYFIGNRFNKKKGAKNG